MRDALESASRGYGESTVVDVGTLTATGDQTLETKPF